MWISITRSLEAYFEDRPLLTGYSSTDQSNQLNFVLYKIVVDGPGSRTIAKKPAAKFYDYFSEQEIPPQRWTAEMHDYAQEAIRNNPVPNPGVKFNTFAKILFALAAAMMVIAVASFIYLAKVKKPQNDLAKASFLKVPVAGDRYFGSIFGEKYRSNTLQCCWIKVLSMNANDSIGTIQLTGEIADHTFETKQVEHEQFKGDTYNVKFKVENGDVIFNAIDSDVEIESSVMSNKYSNYKIQAGQ